MLRHIVLLRLVDDVPSGTVQEIAAALRRLPSVVSSIRSYEVGVDLGLSDGAAQLSVIAEFDDPEGFREYRDHPDHVEVLDSLIRPVLATRLATQTAR